MSKFRRYLKRAGPGEVTRLAKEVGVSHAQISRIADGHRGASLPVAIAIVKATDGALTPSDLVKKPNTTKAKPPRSPQRERA